MAPLSSRPLAMVDVARAAGVHQTTVSLALRNDPRLPAETRQRIQALAEKLGYRPHPLVSALIALRRARRAPKYHTTLAFVVRAGPRGPACMEHLAGARATAERLGYKIDELAIRGAGENGARKPARGAGAELTEQRLDAVLAARNIHGVLVAPLPEASGHFTLNWSRLSAVAIEYTFSEPKFDRVVHDSYDGMRQIMRECRQRGFRRVGLLLSTVGHERTERLNGAAYWIEQKSDPFFVAAPPLFMAAWDERRFASWWQRHEVEVLVTSNDFLPQADSWSAQRKRSGRELRLVNVNADPNGRTSGIFQDPFHIGAVATRLLIEKIAHNERGIPECRQTTLTPGRWVEGRTLAPVA